MGKKYIVLVLICMVSLAKPQMVLAASTTVVINEVQTHSAQSNANEFIEILNIGNVPVRVTDWTLTYLTASGASASLLLELEGALSPGGSALLARSGYLPEADGHFEKGLSESGGHVLLTDATGQEVDRLGWGTATAPESAASPLPLAQQSLQRRPDSLDTDNNAIDFVALTPTPQGGGLQTAPEEPGPTGSCEGIHLSEIVANPAGSDADGGEFVELYNENSFAQSLQNCQLITDKATISLKDQLPLAPHEYRTLSLQDKLLNGSGMVAFVTSTGELERTSYPKLGEDQAWILLDGQWVLSSLSTPGSANVLKVPSPDEAAIPETSITPSCPDGKYRNPDTNRCKTLEDESEPTACKAGQERSAETHRCRAIASAASATSPTTCQSGYERNTATNRCRKVTPPATAKTCPAGQERNPDTNRCRKISAAAPTVNPEPPAGSTGNRLSLGLLTSAGVAALGYAGYEYRTDLHNWFDRCRNRFMPSTSSK